MKFLSQIGALFSSGNVVATHPAWTLADRVRALLRLEWEVNVENVFRVIFASCVFPRCPPPKKTK